LSFIFLFYPPRIASEAPAFVYDHNIVAITDEATSDKLTKAARY